MDKLPVRRPLLCQLNCIMITCLPLRTFVLLFLHFVHTALPLFFHSGAFYAMKAVLSYYHAIQRSGSRLRDTDFMLVMPFVQMSLSRLSKYAYFCLMSMILFAYNFLVIKHILFTNVNYMRYVNFIYSSV